MINKTKNQLLQITLSKSDYERLINIQESLSALLSIDLNKSQTIAFLIKNYGKSPLNKEIDFINEKPRASKNNINYQAQIRALKDKLNVSFTELSAIVGIPSSTLKKYANGTQQPKGENEQLLNDALKKYGIK